MNNFQTNYCQGLSHPAKKASSHIDASHLDTIYLYQLFAI